MRQKSAGEARPMMSRRAVVLGMLGLPFIAAACTGGNGDPEAGKGTFPIDVKHRFGVTTVSERPARIATFGYAAADVCIALGIAPLGMPGSNATPWYNLRRIAEETVMPVLYPDDLELALPTIEDLEPDLIFTTGADLTREQYDRLSEIAPVVHGTSAGKPAWRETVEQVARAVGRPDGGAELIRDTEQLVTASVADYPDLPGTTFLVVEAFAAAGADLGIYGPGSGPVVTLEDFGMDPAPLPAGTEDYDELVDDVFGSVGQIRWPRARAEELRADVLVLVAERRRAKELAEDLSEDLSEDLDLAQQTVLAPKDEMGAAMIMVSSLSLEWLARNFIPVLAEAAFDVRR